MKTLILERHPSEKYGTFGNLYRDGEKIAVTCEPVKPILSGTYLCIPHSGPKFKGVWELQNVPNHTDILIHNGNTIKDTSGCIIVGRTFGRVDGMDAVIDSRLTLARLQHDLPSNFYIKIIESGQPFGTAG